MLGLLLVVCLHPPCCCDRPLLKSDLLLLAVVRCAYASTPGDAIYDMLFDRAVM